MLFIFPDIPLVLLDLQSCSVVPNRMVWGIFKAEPLLSSLYLSCHSILFYDDLKVL